MFFLCCSPNGTLVVQLSARDDDGDQLPAPAPLPRQVNGRPRHIPSAASRERVVISSGFADIFAGNAFKNGLLLVTLPPDAVGRLLAVAQEGQPITVDLDNQVVTTPFQDRFEFAMDPFRKQCLISGQDEIGLTLGMANVITAHEARLAAERPWIAGAAHRVS